MKIIDNADKQKIYESLARELRFIREMVMKIYCDKDYLSLLGKTRMSGLSRAENQIYRCILEAEEYWVRELTLLIPKGRGFSAQRPLPASRSYMASSSVGFGRVPPYRAEVTPTGAYPRLRYFVPH